jgi:hypothetical protein
MTAAAALLANAKKEGLALILEPPSRLRLAGDAAAVARWTPILREHKAEIVALLSRPAAEPAAECLRWQAEHPGEDIHATDMQPSDAAAIGRWLEWIGATPEETAAVIRDCRADPWTLVYFLERSAEVPPTCPK